MARGIILTTATYLQTGALPNSAPFNNMGAWALVTRVRTITADGFLLHVSSGASVPLFAQIDTGSSRFNVSVGRDGGLTIYHTPTDLNDCILTLKFDPANSRFQVISNKADGTGIVTSNQALTDLSNWDFSGMLLTVNSNYYGAGGYTAAQHNDYVKWTTGAGLTTKVVEYLFDADTLADTSGNSITLTATGTAPTYETSPAEAGGASPTLSLGAALTLKPGQSSTATAVAANLSGGQTVTYSWTVISSLGATIAGANTATVTVTAPTPPGDNGVVTLQCVATISGGGGTLTATVDRYIVKVDANDVVQISDPVVSFLIGPHLIFNSPLIPWAHYDVNAVAGAICALRFPFKKPTTSLTGTVAVSNGGTAVVGTGTSFLTEVPPYSILNINNTVNSWGYNVASITDNTHLTLESSYLDATVATAPYGTTGGNNSAENAFIEGMNYYDLVLTMYILFYRTGNPLYQTYARNVADIWWAERLGSGGAWPTNSISPRQLSMKGMMLRALDGKPEYWDLLDRITQDMYDIWYVADNSTSAPQYGINYGRELEYTLMYVLWLAKTLPDSYTQTVSPFGTLNGSTRRATWLSRANTVITWYLTQQQANGAYMGYVDGAWVGLGAQPFIEALTGELLIDYHRAGVGDATSIKNSLLALAESMYRDGFHSELVESANGVLLDGVTRWHGFDYIIYTADLYLNGSPHINLSNVPLAVGVNALRSGASVYWHDYDIGNGYDIMDMRAFNATSLQIWGYCYYLTSNTLWKTRGDTIFSASFGTWGEPGADHFRGNADDFSAYNFRRSKNYNEHHRAGGRYLVWRAAAVQPGGTTGSTAKHSRRTANVKVSSVATTSVRTKSQF